MIAPMDRSKDGIRSKSPVKHVVGSMEAINKLSFLEIVDWFRQTRSRSSIRPHVPRYAVAQTLTIFFEHA
jgi:hypothetical protein